MPESDYTICYSNELGYGNYGTVYSGIRNKDKCPVAIKIFKSNDESIDEINILNYLSNYHFDKVVKIYEVMEVNTKKAIVMERLDGGELFERILDVGCFNEKLAAHCFIDLIEGLIDLNANANVLHRDIKPENLVYVNDDDDSNVKLVDFGLAVKLNSNDIVNGIQIGKRPVGTAIYMSPETILSSTYSEKSDVWSAGVTLYALLSGNAPFDQDNRIKQRKQILSGSYYPLDTAVWSHVSDLAKDLIMKLLTVNPNERISLNEILNHPWILYARSNQLSSDNFHEEYYNHIRSLSSRSNFRRIVNATIWTIRLRKQAIIHHLNEHSTEVSSRSSIESLVKSIHDKSSNNLTNEALAVLNDNLDSLNLSDNQNDTTISLSNNVSYSDLTNQLPDNRNDDIANKMNESYYIPDISNDQIIILREKFINAANECAMRLNTQSASLTTTESNSQTTSIKTESNSQTNSSKTKDQSIFSFISKNPLTNNLPSVDLISFINIMKDVGLPDLAQPHIFNIFDGDGNGMVDYREFLSTIAVFRKSCDDSIKLYFDIFDKDGKGELTFEELKFVISSILHDEMIDNDFDHDHDYYNQLDRSIHSEVVDNNEDGNVASNTNSNMNSNNMQPSNVFKLFHPSQISTNDSNIISSSSSPLSDKTNSSVHSYPSNSPRSSNRIIRENLLPISNVFLTGKTSIEDIFKEMDTNKDGKISFDEFKTWMTNDLHKLKSFVNKDMVL